MLFGRKRRDFAWDQMIKIVEILKVQIVEIRAELDKLHSKVRSKSMTIKEASESSEKENEIDDGLNELRKLYKPEKD